MLDDLIELALELIFEGAMESVHARRKPLYARLALAGILLVLFAGVTGLMVWAGISIQSWPLIALGAALLALGAGLVIRLFQKRRGRHSPKTGHDRARASRLSRSDSVHSCPRSESRCFT